MLESGLLNGGEWNSFCPLAFEQSSVIESVVSSRSILILSQSDSFFLVIRVVCVKSRLETRSKESKSYAMLRRIEVVLILHPKVFFSS